MSTEHSFPPETVVKQATESETTNSQSDSYKYDGHDVTQAEYEYVVSRLQNVSRTFALALGEIRGPAEYYISLAYLACRIPDTIEDEPALPTHHKQALLEEYHRIVSQPLRVSDADTFVEQVNTIIDSENVTITPDWELVRETATVVALLRDTSPEMKTALLPSVQELTLGMRDFVVDNDTTNGILITTLDELESYCYYVAGVVGHLIIKSLLTLDEYDSLKEEDREELLHVGEQYGLYLQFVNISKDVFDDYEDEGSVFIPRGTLNKHGVSIENVTNEEYEDNVANAVCEVVSHATTYEQAAHDFLDYVGQDNDTVRVGFSIPYVLAVATFREVKNNAVEVAKDTDIKISRGEVGWAVQKLHNNHPAPELADMVRETPHSL